MPNIEIHMPKSDERTQVKRRVKELVSPLPFSHEAVVSTHNTECEMLISGEDAPYIRISSTNPDHFEPIRKALEPIEMDIETLPLGDFYPEGKKDS